MENTMTDSEQSVTQKDSKKRLVKALFSYAPVNTDELPLKINDILEVIEETEEGWWKGILDGNVGMFPSNFVIELDEVPEEFNNHLTNELSPLKNCTKKNVIQQDKIQDNVSDGLNHSPSSKSESKQGAVGSVDEEKVEELPAPKCPPDPDKKVMSRSKKLIESAAPRLPPKPVRDQARVMFPYQAQNEDELTLKEGDIITQKKPERPDKPPTAMSSKAPVKLPSSEKVVNDSSPKT
ncbi:CD2-associated protein-like [Uloborus diversus]|uniref:CD2-associated protein-like n=1 Tax=Uloborus diversus TaxID=327109 RepID=UPI002408F3E8|nr:CD2-associated protein-like [Uloborus diversus]